MRIRTCLLLLLAIASACTDPGVPAAEAFEEWSQAAELSQVAVDLLPCRAADEITGDYGAEELSRVWDARILPGGQVAVADALQHAILIFSEEASPTRIGRQGEGPGEFENLRGLFLVADTILAWDQRALRVTAFRAEGDLLWTRRVEAQTGSFTGRTRTGHYPFLASIAPRVGVEGAFRDTTAVLIAHPDSTVIVGPHIPSAYHFSVRAGSGWRSFEQIFTPGLHLAVTGGTAWVGESSTGELVSLGPAGEPMRRLQLGLTPRRATAEMIQAERRRFASGFAGMEYALLADEVPAFSVLPVFASVRGSSDGRLIVTEYSAASDQEYRTWLIDPIGLGVQCVTMPVGSRIVDSQGPVVAVITRDELDVPRVRLRSIDPDT